MADVTTSTAVATDTARVSVRRWHFDAHGELDVSDDVEIFDRQALCDWLRSEGVPVEQVPRDYLTLNFWSRTFTTPLLAYKKDGGWLVHPREMRVMLTEPYTQEWRTEPPNPIAMMNR